MRTAHQPFSLSSEFHAYGAAPRVIRRALACFDTRLVPYFMPMTFMPLVRVFGHLVLRDSSRPRVTWD